jgi:hypothetical protein
MARTAGLLDKRGVDTMKYAMRWHFTVSDHETDELLDVDRLAAHVEDVMDNLMGYEADHAHVADPAIGIDATTGHVEVELVVEADSLTAAISEGETALRQSIHAAGGYTPGWLRDASASVEYDLVDLKLKPIAA